MQERQKKAKELGVCRALDVDLIDVRRVERILVQALEQETTPELPTPLPEGRFARPGSVFAQTSRYRRTA